MRLVAARRNIVMLHENGGIHYPFSRFLTDQHDSPHTRESSSQGLRVLYRFLNAHKIELAQRGLEGRCLTHDEIKKLAALAWYPLAKIDLMKDQKITLITSATAKVEPKYLPGAVEPNTARKRNLAIAEYLKFYHEVFLDPHIRQASLKVDLKQAYDLASEQLREQITGTKQNHHLSFVSLPPEKFVALIRKVMLQPEQVFQTAAGKPSNTLYRDRAMFLLACETLRPGALGNIARADVYDGGHLRVIDNRRRRPGRPTVNTLVLKLGDTVKVNSASETLLELYPFTFDAINDYIQFERKKILSLHLKNRTCGFLFITSTGEPIRDRSTIKKMFSGAGDRLTELGMLDVDDDPYFQDKKRYDFYGYVLRHSAVDFYFRLKGIDDESIKSVKFRCGWTIDSNQWERYSNRILAEHSAVNLDTFYQELLADVAASKSKKETT